jgi:hypothetical protein
MKLDLDNVCLNNVGTSNKNKATRIGIISSTIILVVLICLVSYLFRRKKKRSSTPGK